MRVENDPSARMQVRSMGELVHPAMCCTCGNGTHEGGYLDLGVYLDFGSYDGTVYLCMTCAYEAAETVGCLVPEQQEIITEQVQSVQDALAKITKERDELREYVNSLNRILESKFLISSGTPTVANPVSVSKSKSTPTITL